MRRIFTLTVLLSVSIMSFALDGVTISSTTPYRLVSKVFSTGSVGIGVYHSTDMLVPYIKENADLTDDCYWLVVPVGEDADKVRICNAFDGSYLEYTSAKDYTTYERVKVVATPTDKGIWTIASSEGYLQFYYVDGSTTEYLRISESKLMTKADKGSGEATLFSLVDADGNKVVVPGGTSGGGDTGGGDAGGDVVVTGALDAYVTEILVSGRKPAYDTTNKRYLCVAPVEALTLMSKPVTDGCTIALRDASDNSIESSRDIHLKTDYMLVVLKDGNVVAQSPVVFTSLPIIDITHTGKLKKGMEDYVWGSIRVSSQDEGKTTELQSRIKTRGATASQYQSKPSLNIKLRTLEEDGSITEVDSTLLGIRQCSSWILDAMAIDRIQMRNRVAWDTWNEFSPLPYETNYGSRNGTDGRFVEVLINGAYKGIYCMMDRVNRKLLDLKKTKVDEETGEVTIRGALYKHGTTDIGDQSTVGYFNDNSVYVVAWHDAWELTEPDDYACEEAWTGLNEIYANKSNYEWVKANSYLTQLAEYQVFIIGMSVGDNWGNKNSFVSFRNIQADGDKHRFVYTPWDLDTSLGGSYDGSYYDGNYSNWTVTQAMSASSKPLPFSILDGKKEFVQLMREAWVRGSRGAMSVDGISTKLRNYRQLFLESGAWERQVANPNGARLCTDLTSETEQIIQWYQARFAAMDAYFGTTDEDRSGICTIKQDVNKDDNYYDLSGRRFLRPSRGIYIHDGRKYIK